MQGFYLYLLKAILSLGLVYGFYMVCLRRLTFFQWNRWYLLLYSLMAFLVPFVDINEWVARQPITSPSVFFGQVPTIYHWVSPENQPYQQSLTLQQISSNFSMEPYLLTGMLLITLLFFSRLVDSFYSYKKIIRSGELLGYQEYCQIKRVPKPLAPFSFVNTIVIGNQDYAADELEKIISHEMIHTRQRHSFDILFAEIMIVLAWWNPFTWLIRKSIRQNLEFIADREVINQGVDAKPYQLLLLKTMHNPALRITNAFNFSHIKKRIMMMNVKRSNRLQLARFLLVAPAFALLALLFRSPDSNAQETISKLKLSTSQIENSEIFAEINKDAEDIVQSDTVYFAGIVIHEETGKPVAKFPISISLNKKTLTTLLTDQSGKYFYATPVPQTGKLSSFSWKFLHTEFAPGEGGLSIKDSISNAELYVHIVSPKITKRRSVSEPVPISLKQIAESQFNSMAILNNLAEKSGSIFNTHKELLAQEKEFLSKADTTNKTLVLYKDWLYWKRMENESWSRLEKPENLILKLAEDTVTYEEVNSWFANHKRYPVSFAQANKNKGLLARVDFFTEPFSLPKPTKALLVNGNYQESTLNNFQEEFSKYDAVFINGFRAYRNSLLTNYSDLLSGNANTKIIFKLTGDLAAYYSEKAQVVWWIETKEPNNVFNRPAFADNKTAKNNISDKKTQGKTTLSADVLRGTMIKGELAHTLEAENGIVFKSPELSEEFLLFQGNWYAINTLKSDNKMVLLPDGKKIQITKIKLHAPKDAEKAFGEKGKFGVCEVISALLIINDETFKIEKSASIDAVFEHGKLHVMYVGEHNPIKVYVPGYALQNLTASFSHGTVRMEDNLLIVTPTQASNDAVLHLYNNNELVASRGYKVLGLPSPTVAK